MQHARPHAEVLADRLGMPEGIVDADGPVFAALDEIAVAEEKEGNPVAQGGLGIADKRQDVGNCYLVGAILIDATALEAACPLDHPHMFAQVAIVQIYTELLRP